MNFYDFLNAQNGDRLLGYGVLLIVIVAILVNGIVSTVEHISKRVKSNRVSKSKRSKSANS